MKEYLEFAKKTKYLDLGEYKFSPIIQCSVAIGLDYANHIIKSDNKEIMLISFPAKNNSALWLSVQILVNLFFENYIFQSKNRIKQLNLKRGEKIDIFSTTCRYERIDKHKGELIMSFSDGVIAHTKYQNIQFINKAKKKMVNKYRLYRKNKKMFLSERRALTKILGLDINPNFGALNSKVFLISGRGMAGVFRNMLKETEVYQESLSNVIMLDKNLLISPDFKCFEGSVNSDSDKNTIFFIKAARISISNINSNDEELNDLSNYLLDLMDRSIKSKEFIKSYQKLYNLLQLSEEFESIGVKLQNLFKYHPGIGDTLLNDVSVVIVNDEQLIYEYPETISYLLSQKIPVLIIADRVPNEFKDSYGYKRVFESSEFVGSYRFNWDQKKIESLDLELDKVSKYIDSKNNNLSYQSLLQKFNLIEIEENEFDPIFEFFESRQLLSQFADFELLQKSFYQFLRPLLYIIKNSIERPDVVDLIKYYDSFEEVFIQSSSGFSSDLKQSIQGVLKNLKSYILSGNQPKGCNDEIEDLFYQDVFIDDKVHTLPLQCESKKNIHHNFILDEKKTISFIGYPYREYYYKYLEESVFVKFIPEVNITLNKSEYSITKIFLLKKLKSGYFIEKYPPCLDRLEPFRVSSEKQIESILEDLFISANEEFDVEESTIEELVGFEKMLNEIRYSGYSGSINSSDDGSQYLLKCNILHFENSNFLFLPHTWRVLLLKESISGNIESVYCKIEDVAIGDIAVVVNVSRKSISKYLESSDSMMSYLSTLESWKDIIKEEYQKHNDISKLKDKLHRINESCELNGSPEHYNVLRWLHDDMILAPALENLLMILALRYPKEKLDEKAKDILRAKTIILKAKNKLDKAVKLKLTEKIINSNNELEDNFQIDVQGIKVNGKKSKIVSIEMRKDLLIEYHSTVKFIQEIC